MGKGPARPIPRQRSRSNGGPPGTSAHLDLLGGWALYVDDSAVAMSANGQRLLAFLALRGRCRRDYVAGVLWPEYDDQSALANLRTTLWRVRRCAPGSVSSTQKEVALAPAITVDVNSLIAAGKRLLRQDRPCSPEDLVEIGRTLAHHHTLLPGWYDDWVLLERERLQQAQVHALEVAADRLVQSRQLGAALEVAHAATMVEPFRETAHCAVVTVLLEQANPAQAVRHYQQYQRLLDRELGIEPSGRLQDLVRPVLGGELQV